MLTTPARGTAFKMTASKYRLELNLFKQTIVEGQHESASEEEEEEESVERIIIQENEISDEMLQAMQLKLENTIRMEILSLCLAIFDLFADTYFYFGGLRAFGTFHFEYHYSSPEISDNSATHGSESVPTQFDFKEISSWLLVLLQFNAIIMVLCKGYIMWILKRQGEFHRHVVAESPTLMDDGSKMRAGKQWESFFHMLSTAMEWVCIFGVDAAQACACSTVLLVTASDAIRAPSLPLLPLASQIVRLIVLVKRSSLSPHSNANVFHEGRHGSRSIFLLDCRSFRQNCIPLTKGILLYTCLVTFYIALLLSAPLLLPGVWLALWETILALFFCFACIAAIIPEKLSVGCRAFASSCLLLTITVLLGISAAVLVSVIFHVQITECARVVSAMLFLVSGFLIMGGSASILPVVRTRDGQTGGLAFAWLRTDPIVRKMFLPRLSGNAISHPGADNTGLNNADLWEEGRRRRDRVERWLKHRRKLKHKQRIRHLSASPQFEASATKNTGKSDAAASTLRSSGNEVLRSGNTTSQSVPEMSNMYRNSDPKYTDRNEMPDKSNVKDRGQKTQNDIRNQEPGHYCCNANQARPIDLESLERGLIPRRSI